MNFEEYQQESRTTAIYPDQGKNWIYVSLGLGGEVGELLNKLKKIQRDNLDKDSEEFREIVKEELGDVLWYVANVAFEFGLKLDDVAISNLEKLKDRKKRNMISGSGDKR